MGFLLSFGIISELLECSFFPVRRFLIIHFPLFFLLFMHKKTRCKQCVFLSFSYSMRNLFLPIQAQYNRKYDKYRCQNFGELFHRPFHGAPLILAPVGIGYTVDRSGKTCGLSLLHQHNNRQCYTNQNINYRYNSL